MNAADICVAVFVLAVVAWVLGFIGCTPALPPEPPIVMTCTNRDAGR